MERSSRLERSLRRFAFRAAEAAARHAEGYGGGAAPSCCILPCSVQPRRRRSGALEGLAELVSSLDPRVRAWLAKRFARIPPRSTPLPLSPSACDGACGVSDPGGALDAVWDEVERLGLHMLPVDSLPSAGRGRSSRGERGRAPHMDEECFLVADPARLVRALRRAWCEAWVEELEGGAGYEQTLPFAEAAAAMCAILCALEFAKRRCLEAWRAYWEWGWMADAASLPPKARRRLAGEERQLAEWMRVVGGGTDAADGFDDGAVEDGDVADGGTGGTDARRLVGSVVSGRGDGAPPLLVDSALLSRDARKAVAAAAGLGWVEELSEHGDWAAGSGGGLCAMLEDAENRVDGILLMGETASAASTPVFEALRGRVAVCYGDPPYNRGSRSTAEGVCGYLDTFTRGEWEAMFGEVLGVVMERLDESGVAFFSIDDAGLGAMLDVVERVAGRSRRLPLVVWRRKKVRGRGMRHLLPHVEYVVAVARDPARLPPFLEDLDERMRSAYRWSDERGPYKRIPLAKTGTRHSGRPNLVYPLTAPDGGVVECPTHQWRWCRERVERELAAGRVEFVRGRDGKWRVYTKQYLYGEDGMERGATPSVFIDGPYAEEASREQRDLFGRVVFGFPKPLGLVARLLRWRLRGGAGRSWVLDPFAGTGVTGHAVLELARTRERPQERPRFVLAERAPAVFALLRLRLQRALLCPRWRAGRPAAPLSPGRRALWLTGRHHPPAAVPFDSASMRGRFLEALRRGFHLEGE